VTERVTIDLGHGETVEAEVIGDLPFQDVDGDMYGDVGVPRRVAELGTAVAMTMDQVRGTVRNVGRWAAETITDSAGSPDTFEVEFGLKLAVKSGQLLGVIAEAGSEASLTVRMSWDLASRRAARAADAACATATPGLPGGDTGATSGATAMPPAAGTGPAE
jgi:hypothetical protein